MGTANLFSTTNYFIFNNLSFYLQYYKEKVKDNQADTAEEYKIYKMCQERIYSVKEDSVWKVRECLPETRNGEKLLRQNSNRCLLRS